MNNKQITLTSTAIAIAFFTLLALAVFTPLINIILSVVAIILLLAASVAVFFAVLITWDTSGKEYNKQP